MEKNINIFNAIATIKALASDNDAIKAVLVQLEKEVEGLQVQYTCTTGLNTLNQQKEARNAILDELFPARTGERTVQLPCSIVDAWVPWIAGPIDNQYSIRLSDRRRHTDYYTVNIWRLFNDGDITIQVI